MARRRIDRPDGLRALQQYLISAEESARTAVDRRTKATAVRFLLEELSAQAPGNSVEVRVPPFGVTQCGEGPRHTRGTPPNVVELSAEAWLDLATGRQGWDAAMRQSRISASGIRADLREMLPLIDLDGLPAEKPADA